MRRCGVVGRILAFQPCEPGSIDYGVMNFNLYLGNAYVPLSVFCPVLFLAMAILLTTDSGRPDIV